MFGTGDPVLKIRIDDPTRVPAAYATVVKIVAKAQVMETSVSCKAFCANSDTADSWEAFIQTIGVTPQRTGNDVYFEVLAEDISELTLPAVSIRRAVVTGS